MGIPLLVEKYSNFRQRTKKLEVIQGIVTLKSQNVCVNRRGGRKEKMEGLIFVLLGTRHYTKHSYTVSFDQLSKVGPVLG